MKRFLVSSAVALTMLASAPSASASTIVFDLNQGGFGSVGTVTVSQVTPPVFGVVNILVDLNDGVNFVKTGNGTNHPTFAFNLDEPWASAITAADITLINDGVNGVWTWSFIEGPYAVSGGGMFAFEYNCTNCNSGSSPPTNPGPLEFNISLALIRPESFIGNETLHYVFAADIFSQGNTGMVFAVPGRTVRGCEEDNNCGTEAPEPATLALLGTGLAMAAFGLRRRAKKS